MAGEEVAVRVRLKERLKFSRDARKAGDDVEGIGRSGDKASVGIGRFNKSMLSAQNIIRLVKPVALITALGLVAQGASAATAGVVGLVAGMTPMVGIIAAVPSVGIAAASSMILLRGSLSGVGDALGGLNEKIDESKLENLSPAAQQLVVELDKMKKPILWIQGRAQEGMFPGLTTGIQRAGSMLYPFGKIAEMTGRVIGGLAAQTGSLVASWKNDLPSVAGTNAVVIQRMGRTTIYLVSALWEVVNAAQPLVRWITRATQSWAASLAVQAKAGRESGRMASFFLLVRRSLSLTMGIVKPFTKALVNIFAAVMPGSLGLLGTLQKTTENFERWTASAAGQNTIRKWFDDSMPAILEIGRLIRDVTHAFFQLGKGSQVAPLLAMIRQDLLPAIVSLVDTTTKEFGPVLIPAIRNVALVMADLAGASGPLSTFVTIIGRIAGAAHNLFSEHPQAQKLVVQMLGLMAVMKTIGMLGFASKIFGVGKAFEMMKKAVVASKAVMLAFKNACILTRIQLIGIAIAEKARAAATILANAATKIATGFMAAFNAVLALNPIGLIIVGVIALAALFVVLYKKVGWFRDGVNAVFGFVKKHWKLIAVIMLGPIALVIGAIIKFRKQIWGAVTGAVSTVIGFVRKHWKTILMIMTGPVGAIVIFVVSKFNSIVNFVKKLPGRIKSASQGMFDGFKDAFKGALNWIIGKWNSFELTLKLPKRLGGGGVSIGTPNIPKMFAGGIVRAPGMVSVGEFGREALTLPEGARVDPLPPSSFSSSADELPTLAQPASGTIEVPVYIDGREVARAVSRAVADDKARR